MWLIHRRKAFRFTVMDYMEYASNAAAQAAYVSSDSTPLQSYSEPTIKTQGTYSLKLSATTDALNEMVTKTLTGGDIIDLSGKNTIKFDARGSETGGNLEVALKDLPETATKLLLSFDGADGAVATTDRSQSNHSVSFNGTAQIDSSAYKWGNAALLLDGDSDCIEITDSTDWDIVASNSDDWTIHFWVKFADHTGDETLIAQYEDANNFWMIHHEGSSGLTFQAVSGGVGIIFTSYAAPISDTDWHHIALCKVSSLYGIYKDGAQINYTNDTSTDTFAGNLFVGARDSSLYFFNGSIDELHIVNSNIFAATPNATPNDSITIPNDAYLRNAHTINIATADTWQEESWDISGIADADKNAIDQIEFKVLDASSAQDFYIDNMRAEGAAMPFMYATGGDITFDGDYKIHTFLADGTFEVTEAGTVECLVVAGGGGGGGRQGGGGGAGGYISAYNFAVVHSIYPITVGDGGIAGTAGNIMATSGGNSIFGSLIAIGGGGGSNGYNGGTDGDDGGSGGGGGFADTVYAYGGAGTTQGYDGGRSSLTSSGGGAGGGGGANADGIDCSGEQSGPGGAGKASVINGTSIYRAGGGGGGNYSTRSAGNGGVGGGGNGSNTGNGSAGSINTGGGGGGGGGTTLHDGGAGGSGIVIIRYKYK